MSTVGETFREDSITYLRDTYLPRIERALELIEEGDTWWRPHDDATSVGNLLAHLAGNVRQWIVSGLGGEDDHRDRPHEFVPARSEHCPTLLENLHEAVTDACAVIEHLTDEDLLAVHGIQGSEVTAMNAIYHVVEHFAWHTGQIVWIAKLRAGSDHGLAFYDEARVNAARND